MDDCNIYLLPVSLGLSVFATIGILMISCAYMKLYKINSRLPRSIKCVTFIANTFALLGSFTIFALFLYLYVTSIPINTPRNYIFMAISSICISTILPISSNIIFLLRLQYTFKDSIYRMSNCAFAMLLVLFCIYAIVYFYIDYNIILVAIYNGKTIEINKVLPIGHEIAIVVQTITNISMLILFNGSLLKLAKTVKAGIENEGASVPINTLKINTLKIRLNTATFTESETYKTSETHKKSETHKHKKSETKESYLMEEERQETLIKVVTKITILVTVSTIFAAISQIGFVILDKSYNGFHQFLIKDIQCLYCLLEVICLYLSYASNDKLYSTLCCGCNHICYAFCQCIARKN